MNPLTTTRTFLFTDIEGSMRLWDTDSVGMSRALAEHDRLVQHLISAQGGRVFATTGDGFGAAFESADSAFAATMAIQLELATSVIRPRLWVRAGIHTGPAEERAGNFYGPTLNHCARLTKAAAGGQILASCDSIAALRRPFPAWCLGTRQLGDLTPPMSIYQLFPSSPPDLERRVAAMSA